MTVWNVNLGRRQKNIRVIKVLLKEPGFMVVLDDLEKQHRLSEVDFPSYEWEKIGPGATVTLTISESVTRWIVKAPRVQEYVDRLILEARKGVSGLFFIWICQNCGTAGHVGYEDGDDPEIIAAHIAVDHVKTAKLGCRNNIRIFDHRGIEQRDSSLFFWARMAGKPA